ncbi:hypothetical protein HHI36_009874 [Cryptolaemus montrouzieri]|uniref:DDE-1 domain-containing protein n=1 Tax=Cryptolaemus montrouzieri TaxID=559131 RepID=A0ABD2MH44_9CUCU
MIWDPDDSGFMFVMKSGKIVAFTGKKYVYEQTFGEKGTTMTVLTCISVNGDSISSVTIFKGKRRDDRPKSLQNFSCLIKLSEKVWINNELFLESFKHFVESIPLARLVVLIMDPHKSHSAPKIVELAVDSPGEKPTRYNSMNMFSRAYTAALYSRALVRNAFKRADIFPIDYNVIPDTAVTSSLVSASEDPNITEEGRVESYGTLEENCNMSHQSNEGEKENVEPQSGASAVSDILIIQTMNKPSKETTKKNK